MAQGGAKIPNPLRSWCIYCYYIYEYRGKPIFEDPSRERNPGLRPGIKTICCENAAEGCEKLGILGVNYNKLKVNFCVSHGGAGEPARFDKYQLRMP